MSATNIDDTDEGLIVKIRNGDNQAFTALVNKHNNGFYGLCYRMLGNGAEAEDVIQDSFLKIWKNPYGWNEKKNSKFTTWFYRVVINACNDVLRKRGRMVPDTMLSDFASDNISAYDNIENREKQMAVEKALGLLPSRQRIAIELCYYEGLKNKEAAYIMKINVKAIESLLSRGKSRLKDFMLREGFIIQVLIIWMMIF